MEPFVIYAIDWIVQMSNPTQDFNACEDFFCTVVESHIVTASLHYLNMSKMDDIPKHETLTNPEDIWMQPDSERKVLLMNVCDNIVREYVHF